MNDTAGEVAGYDEDDSSAAYTARMIAEGWRVDVPKSNELQIDIDRQEHLLVFGPAFDILTREIVKQYGAPPTLTRWPSRGTKHQGGEHILVALPFDVTPVERIAWQAALGSDPFRELLSMFRAHRGDPTPTVFTEKPEKTLEEAPK